MTEQLYMQGIMASKACKDCMMRGEGDAFDFESGIDLASWTPVEAHSIAWRMLLSLDPGCACHKAPFLSPFKGLVTAHLQ